MSAEAFSGLEPGTEDDALATDTEARLGWAAMMLASDVNAYEALISGLAVPRARLEPGVLEILGEPLVGPDVELTAELALRVEVARPPGEGTPSEEASSSWEPQNLALLGPRDAIQPRSAASASSTPASGTSSAARRKSAKTLAAYVVALVELRAGRHASS